MYPQKYVSAQLFSILMIINVPWVANQHVRIISKGSSGTEDCNDAENSASHHMNKLNFIIR